MLGGVLAGVTASGVYSHFFNQMPEVLGITRRKWSKKDMKLMALHMAKVQKFIKQPWSVTPSETSQGYIWPVTKHLT